jgi:hypothetical protein
VTLRPVSHHSSLRPRSVIINFFYSESGRKSLGPQNRELRTFPDSKLRNREVGGCQISSSRAWQVSRTLKCREENFGVLQLASLYVYSSGVACASRGFAISMSAFLVHWILPSGGGVRCCETGPSGDDRVGQYRTCSGFRDVDCRLSRSMEASSASVSSLNGRNSGVG